MSYAYKYISNYFDLINYSFTSNFEKFEDAYEVSIENEEKTFLEVLNRKKRFYRFYMDIDGIPKDSDLEQLKIFFDKLAMDFVFFINKYGLNKKLEHEEYYKTIDMIKVTCNQNSNTHEGIGFHVIFPFAFFNDGIYNMKKLIILFVEQFKQEHKGTGYVKFIDYIDCSIYTKNRLFRTIFNYQPGMYKNGKRIKRDLKSYHYPVCFDSGDGLKFELGKSVSLNEFQGYCSDYFIQNIDCILRKGEYINLKSMFIEARSEYYKLCGSYKSKFKSQNNYKKEEIEKMEEKKEDIKINKLELKDIPINIYEQQNKQFKYLLLLITIINIICLFFNIFYK